MLPRLRRVWTPLPEVFGVIADGLMHNLAVGINVGIDLDEALMAIGRGRLHKQITQRQPQRRDNRLRATPGKTVQEHFVGACGNRQGGHIPTFVSPGAK